MTSDAPLLLWFRRDLRLTDNPALHAAVQTGRPIQPVYILDRSEDWADGAAASWWLHHSLEALSKSLRDLGLGLVLRRGRSAEELRRLIAETGAQSVYWNRLYEPDAVARDTKLKQAIGVETKSFNSGLLCEPWELKTASGTPFRVFTPFFRALQAAFTDAAPFAKPTRARAAQAISGDRLTDWRLTPSRPDWAKGFWSYWRPGEAGALDRLETFARGALSNYASNRDIPGLEATSRLSPHLHFGEVGPRQIWRAASLTGDTVHADKFKSEVAWREFSHHLLFHYPALPSQNLRREFDAFPWRNDEADFNAWSRGRTGIPIVDAGMRELWATGWMHNRVRMVVASFLAKNLMIDWRRGAHWFWDTLVDADLANNSASWQWVAGCGADAAPYFRIFNPVLQGRKFDPVGAYVRAWVPELRGLDNEVVHAPWTASAAQLSAANISLGVTYPLPIADLAATRARALDAFAALKTAA